MTGVLQLVRNEVHLLSQELVLSWQIYTSVVPAELVH